MKVLVLGSGGMVGSCLVRFLQVNGEDFSAFSKSQLDITSLENLEKLAQHLRPAYIFNCAALTNVDVAESNPALAFAVNATGACHVGMVARKIGAKLIHLSTDYVFSSSGPAPFTEDDPTCPINVYGQSKLQGELMLREVMPSSCIVRTSWVYGALGKNFISSIASMLQEKTEIQVADDQRGKPTFCHDLVQALWDMKDLCGTYHFSGAEALSRFEIAQKIFSYMKASGMALTCQNIIPVKAALFHTPARRPSFSVLDTKKFQDEVQRSPRAFTDTLTEFFHEITS